MLFVEDGEGVRVICCNKLVLEFGKIISGDVCGFSEGCRFFIV